MNSIIADQKIQKRRRARAGGFRPAPAARGPSPWEFRSFDGSRVHAPRSAAPTISLRPERPKSQRRRRRAPSLFPLIVAFVGAVASTLSAFLSRPRRPPRVDFRLGPLPFRSSAGAGNVAAEGLSLKFDHFVSGLRRFFAAPLAPANRRTTAVAAVLPALAMVGALVLREPAFPLPDGEFLPEDPATYDMILSYVAPEPSLAEGTEAEALPPPPTTLEYQSYTVRKGDTLLSIASRFGRSIDTLIAINGISAASAIKSGAIMRIPNMNGLVHLVKPGESIGSIAGKYKTGATDIIDANDLGTAVIRAGQSLFIPGARLPDSELRRVLGIKIEWPLRGSLSSYYGYRANPFTGVRQFHGGIDIVVDTGTPVKAALDGRVADVGYNSNFGNYVIITHVDGLQTLYAHLSSIVAPEGARVKLGATIGLSGNTGYSTGPHLHFGVYKKGVSQNPIKYLK